MKKEEFRKILSDYFLPMFSGTKLGETKESTSYHSLSAYENPCSLLLKPEQTSDFRVQFQRSQPFARSEKTLVDGFMKALTEVVGQTMSPYFHDLMLAIPRRVVASYLGPEHASRTLQSAIQQFESLASQTYEGLPIVSALGLTGSVSHGPVRLTELWAEDFSAVLSNGFDSIFVCGSDGRVFNLAYLPLAKKTSFAPYRLGSIAEWCSKKKRVAMALNRSGEILLFQDRRLQFAKRRGAWRYYPHDSMVMRLGVGIDARVRTAVYESCLDVSFARTGGCIAVLDANSTTKANKVLNKEDLITTGKKTRTKLLRSAIKKRFHNLDRRFRQELLAMDGATVLDRTGSIITSGAIVTVPSGSVGGGRRAAAVELSKLGLGIKISSDGPITGFRRKRVIMSV